MSRSISGQSTVFMPLSEGVGVHVVLGMNPVGVSGGGGIAFCLHSNL